MRVLYIIHSSAHSGALISFLNMVEGLRARDVEMEVLGPSLCDDLYNILCLLKVDYHSISVAESVYPSCDTLEDRILFLPRILNLLRRKRSSYREINKRVSRFRPDIIHTNVGTIHEGFRIARKMKVPHIWHLREYQDKDFGWLVFPSKKSFIKKLKKSYVITITRDIRDYFGLKETSETRVIYNGVYPRDNICSEWPKSSYFLCSSRISREKGIDETIRAFAQFYQQNNHYQLVILGEGDPAIIQELKQEALDLGCDMALRWEGYKDNVFEYMRHATALIVASHHEGFGRMTAEACFAGCLVIGRNTGGTKEIIDYVGGLLFDSTKELTEQMIFASKLSKEDYQERAIVSQDRAKEAYSIEANVESVYALYRHVIADNEKNRI